MPTPVLSSRSTGPSLNATHNDLPEKSRQKMVHQLQAHLCDALDLSMQCKQAHWTIKGPHFAALHALFDEAHNEARGWVDDIAERAVSLGGHVVGTAQRTAERSRLPAYPTDTQDGLRHVQALAQAMACFAKHTRAGIAQAEACDDAVSADLLTGITRAVDKRLWMLEAHS